MKADPEQRAVQLGVHCRPQRHGAAAAAAFRCSKSTVHKDVAVRLRQHQPCAVRAGARRAGPQQAERHPAGRGCHPAQTAAAGPKTAAHCAKRSFC